MLPKIKNLELIRGDSFFLPLSIKNFLNSSDYIYLDSVDFICAGNYSESVVFHKQLGDGITVSDTDSGVSYLIKVLPEDTKNVDSGSYRYELSIGKNGDTFTLLKGEFTILSEVTV